MTNKNQNSKNVPWIHENCGRCGRQLKTEKSKYAGYGPVCLQKVEVERAKQQTTIDDYIEPMKVRE